MNSRPDSGQDPGQDPGPGPRAMKVDDFAKGFALMKQGSCGKVVLDWG